VTYPENAFTDLGAIRTNWSVGVWLNIPILTGGRQRADEVIARAQLDAQRAEYELTQELADLDARSVWAAVVAAHSTWQAGFASIDLARRAYEIAEVRYRAGVSTQLELSDARLQLQQAEADHALAARHFQVARIRLALLPELPVSTPVSPLAEPQQMTEPATPSITRPGSIPGVSPTVPRVQRPGGFR
jgi:outer membrane protein TolC